MSKAKLLKVFLLNLSGAKLSTVGEGGRLRTDVRAPRSRYIFVGSPPTVESFTFDKFVAFSEAEDQLFFMTKCLSLCERHLVMSKAKLSF